MLSLSTFAKMNLQATTDGGTMTEVLTRPLPWVYDNGGRADAGFKGTTGDCGARAVAIATGLTYREVYDAINAIARNERLRKRERQRSNARTGVHRHTMDKLMAALGWEWVPLCTIGQKVKHHLVEGELPSGRLVALCSKHYTAVVDGVIRDTYNPGRDGSRMVYGYYRESK